MAPLRVPRPLVHRRLESLQKSVSVAVDGRHLPPEALAIIERVKASAEAALRSHDSMQAIEVEIRPDTLLDLLAKLNKRFGVAFRGMEDVLQFGYVCKRCGPESLSENPALWDDIRARLLKTPPRKGCHKKEMIFDLTVRPGERRLIVPGMEESVEVFLRSSHFADELRQHHRIPDRVKIAVNVGGKYLSEDDLDQVYGSENPKREAAARLDSLQREGLPPEQERALLTGNFELIDVPNGPFYYEKLRALAEDPSVSVALNANPNIDTGTIALYKPGALFGLVPYTGGRIARKKLVLCCLRPVGEGKPALEKVRQALVFEKAGS